MSVNDKMTSSNRWEILCSEQGWSVDSKYSMMESFIKDVGLMSSFLKYAQEVADIENSNLDDEQVA